MILDFKMTPDGDLDLGQQATNDDGNLLYYTTSVMEDPGVITSDVTENTIPIRDLDIAYGEEADLQLIKTRFRTDAPDWLTYPNLGANISELAGELNNEKTALKGKAMILSALTDDQAFQTEELEIDYAPVSISEIIYDIKLSRRSNVNRYVFLLNLEQGVLNYYEEGENE